MTTTKSSGPGSGKSTKSRIFLQNLRQIANATDKTSQHSEDQISTDTSTHPSENGSKHSRDDKDEPSGHDFPLKKKARTSDLPLLYHSTTANSRPTSLSKVKNGPSRFSGSAAKCDSCFNEESLELTHFKMSRVRQKDVYQSEIKNNNETHHGNDLGELPSPVFPTEGTKKRALCLSTVSQTLGGDIVDDGPPPRPKYNDKGHPYATLPQGMITNDLGATGYKSDPNNAADLEDEIGAHTGGPDIIEKVTEDLPAILPGYRGEEQPTRTRSQSHFQSRPSIIINVEAPPTSTCPHQNTTKKAPQASTTRTCQSQPKKRSKSKARGRSQYGKSGKGLAPAVAIAQEDEPVENVAEEKDGILIACLGCDICYDIKIDPGKKPCYPLRYKILSEVYTCADQKAPNMSDSSLNDDILFVNCFQCFHLHRNKTDATNYTEGTDIFSQEQFFVSAGLIEDWYVLKALKNGYRLELVDNSRPRPIVHIQRVAEAFQRMSKNGDQMSWSRFEFECGRSARARPKPLSDYTTSQTEANEFWGKGVMQAPKNGSEPALVIPFGGELDESRDEAAGKKGGKSTKKNSSKAKR